MDNATELLLSSDLDSSRNPDRRAGTNNVPVIPVFMAQNGAFNVSASVASRLAARNQSPPPVAAPTQQQERISLAQPRPDGLRTCNYYTETPFRPPQSPKKSGGKDDNGNVPVHGAGGRATHHLGDAGSRSGRTPAGPNTTHCHIAGAPVSRLVNSQQTITTQPSSVFKKEKPDSDSLTDHPESSVFCHQCGRCKCDGCRNPRPLPSAWICDDKCECSAEAVLDTCTCMCCVKAAFYHCTDYDTDGDVSCADNPCSCSPPRRCLRWGCMGVLALVLPCLCCYWPMKGCIKMCEVGYGRYHNNGCRCMERRKKEPGSPPNKRLLEPGAD